MTDSIEELSLDVLALLLDDAAGVLEDDGRQNMPKILRAAALKLRELREALQYVDDCFNAAMIEGWIDAKAEGDIERIRDIWQRRISYAWSNTINVLQDGKGE